MHQSLLLVSWRLHSLPRCASSFGRFVHRATLLWCRRSSLASLVSALLLVRSDLSPAEVRALRSCMDHFSQFYSAVSASRWSTLVSKAWRDVEHINALELRSALLAVQWALSFPSSLHTRVYLLLDSTVALFSLWKGRSSSPKLLLILRQISACLLAGGVSLLCGWLPSEVNPADAPSRLLPSSSKSC